MLRLEHGTATGLELLQRMRQVGVISGLDKPASPGTPEATRRLQALEVFAPTTLRLSMTELRVIAFLAGVELEVALDRYDDVADLQARDVTEPAWIQPRLTCTWYPVPFRDDLERAEMLAEGVRCQVWRYPPGLALQGEHAALTRVVDMLSSTIPTAQPPPTDALVRTTTLAPFSRDALADQVMDDRYP